MFTVTFSTVYMNFRVNSTTHARRRRRLLTVDFIIYELSMVFRYVYLVVYFHRLGQRVSVIGVIRCSIGHRVTVLSDCSLFDGSTGR